MFKKRRIKIYGEYRKGIKIAMSDAKKRGTYLNGDRDTSYNPWQFMSLYNTEGTPLKAYMRAFFPYWRKFIKTLSPEEVDRRWYNLMTDKEQAAYNTKELLKKVSSGKFDKLQVNSIIAKAITTETITTNAITKKDVTGE